LPFLSFVFRWKNFGFGDFPDFINFSFSPGALIVYIILWLVLPEASSTAEKLEMKGEKVDIDSIKTSVKQEMKGVQKRAEKFGEEVKTFAEGKGQQMGSEIKTAVKRGGTSLGDVIVILVKAFVYFIIGCVSIAMVVALFGVAIASIGIFPLKDFVLTEGWQNAFAWGTLLFFIAVPVIGVITWIIRRLAKMKRNSKVLTASFISLWILGWVCFTCLLASVTKDFKTINNIAEQEVTLTNADVAKLEVTTNSPEKKLYRYRSFNFQPFEGIEDDTAYIKNIEVKIVKSPNDLFKVTMAKMANGRTRRYADTLANLIQFNAMQRDSLLVLDKGIAINTTDKFRNQRVVITVYVPVGKQIKINSNVGRGHYVHMSGPWNNDEDFNIDLDDEENGWDENVDYVMRADGLYTLDGTPADEWKNDNDKKIKINKNGIEINDGDKKINIDENGVKIDDNYRYDQNNTIDKIDSLKNKLEKDQQRIKDSLEKVKENIEKQLEKIGINESKDEGSLSYNTMLMMNPLTSLL